MRKMMKKLALLLCMILTVNSVLVDVTIPVKAETETTSATVTFTYDDTSLALGEVQWKNGDEDWHTQDRNGTVSATHLRIKYDHDGVLAPHTALRIDGTEFIGANKEALDSEEGMALEAGVQYEFEHIQFYAPSGGEDNPPGPGPEPGNGPEQGEVQINVSNAQNGTIAYKINDGEWIEINGNPFTLRKGHELEGVADGAKIYFKVSPNQDQEIDAYDGQNRIRYNGEDHSISAESLLEGSYYFELDSETVYFVQFAFEGSGEPGGDNPPLPEVTDPYEIIVTVSGYEENFFYEDSPIRIDGYDVREGKVTVNKAETHTIEVQIAFGAGLSKFIVNDVECEFKPEREDRYSVEVAEASNYAIELVKGEGHSASIVWNYDREEAIRKYGNDDAWVENGRVELVSIKRDGEFIYDETNTDEGYKPDENGVSVREDGGDIFLEKGDDVVLRLIPFYGYQLTSVNINGVDELKPEENVSTFSIDNIQGNIHFKGVFQTEEDIIRNNSASIIGANIADGENAAESGNLQLTISDNSEYTKDVTEAVAGDNIEKVVSIDLALENVVSKGSEGAYWNTNITTFENDIRVALDIDFSTLSEGQEFTVVRDHEGELEELEVLCDFEHGVIDFPTNKFSTYTIVKKDGPKSDITDEMWIWDPSIEKYVYVIDDKNPCDDFTNIYVPTDKVLIIAKDYEIAGNLTVDIFGTLQIEKGCKLTKKEGANLDMLNLSSIILGDDASKDLFTPLKVKKTGHQELLDFKAPAYNFDNTEFILIDGNYIYYDGPDSGFNLNTNGTIVLRDEEGKEVERRGTIDYKVTTDGKVVNEGTLKDDWDEVNILPENFKVGTEVEFTVHVKEGYRLQTNGVRFPNNKNTISKKEDEDKATVTCSYTLDEEPSGFLSLTVDFINPGEEREYAEFCWSYDSDVTKTDDGWDKYIEHGTVDIVSVTKNGETVTNGTADNPPYWSAGESFEPREEGDIRWNEKFALFEEGTTVVARLIPDRGYQLTRFNISNIAKTTEAVEGVNEYTFYLDRPDIYHLSAVFSPVDDAVDASSATGINGGSVTFAEDEITNGTMALNVSDIEPSAEEMDEFTKMADAEDFSIAQCINLESEQRFYKGVEDATRDQCWVIEKSELSKPASIELEMDGMEADEVFILHNHNGEYEKIPATFENGKVIFEAQSFSDFAIATKVYCKHPQDKLVVVHAVLPGCETEGEDALVCSECELVLDTAAVPAVGHNYVNGKCAREGCGIVSLALCKDIKVEVVDEIYDGNERLPEIKVSYKGVELEAGQDFDVDIDAESEIGTYDFNIIGFGDFTDEISGKWSITPDKGLWCADIPDQIFTGTAIKPSLDVYCDGTKLVAGKDYTITYKNNVKVAEIGATDTKGKSIAPTVIVTGKGNYSEKKEVQFAIKPCPVNTAVVNDILVAGTGKNIKINPVVTLNGKKLKLGTDYVVSTSEKVEDAVVAYKDADVYELYAVGKGSYTGAVAFKFTITSDVLASKVAISKIAAQKYDDGKEIKPEIKLTYNKADVTDKFEISYENNSEVGTATVIVMAKEGSGFAGSKQTTFKITGTPVTGAKLGADGKEKIPAAIYSGIAYEPELNLYIGTKQLIKNVDYTIAYTKNVNVGSATATITGKGNYTGTKKFTFKINKFDAQKDAEKIIVSCPAGVAYEKGGVTPKPVVKMGDVVLTEKTDYTLSYANNKAVAKADAVNSKNKSIAPTITVTFKGNYSGKKSVNFEITAKNIKEGNITIADKGYSTKPNAWKQTAVTIIDTNGKKLVAGTDYDKVFTYYSDDKCEKEITDAIVAANKTVFVKVSGIKNYDGSSIIGSYRVSNTNISSVKVVINDKQFTGNEVKLDESDIKVTIGKDKRSLTLGDDYEIVEGSYVNNISKGTASVTIKGIGEYYGTKVVKFKIGAKQLLWWE